MAFTFPFLKSAFTSLGGARVDVDILRKSIIDGGIIVQALVDQPEGIRWIDEVADPTLQFSFVTDLPAPEETELNNIVAAHTGPPDVSSVVRFFTESTPPTVTDDFGKDFEVGDVWYDTSTDHFYQLSDSTVGAARWEWISGWGLSRPTKLTKLRADLQTSDESDPAASKLLVTDGSGDFDLQGWGSSQDRGYFEDFGADTTASSSTPVARMNESPTLVAGRYEILWTSELEGTDKDTEPRGRFSFDGVLIDEYTVNTHGDDGDAIARTLERGRDGTGEQLPEVGRGVTRCPFLHAKSA